MEVWRSSYIVEVWKIVLIRCWVSSTIMTPRTREEKFLHHGSVEKILYRGSIEDCADLLLGIKHHNDSYIMVVWRSSYTVEVWKRSFIILETAFERAD